MARLVPAHMLASDDCDASGIVPIWLLSDLIAANTRFGGISVCASATDLGLPGGEIDWSASQVRTRNFSIWNRKRGGFERERIALCKGSVLAWRPAPASSRIASGERSVGLYTEAGYGRIWIAPPVLRDQRPSFDTNALKVPRQPREGPTTASAVEAAVHPLLGWLDARVVQAQRAASTHERVRSQCLDGVLKWYEHARHSRGLAADAPVGPSSSQWRDLVALVEAESARLRSARMSLGVLLFESESAPLRDGKPGWSDRFFQPGAHDTDGGMTDFRSALKTLVRQQALDAAGLALLARWVSTALQGTHPGPSAGQVHEGGGS